MKDRAILHVDCNAFYFGCEASRRPSLHGKAVVVGGDEEARHGIVLAKSDLAKAAGIKTGHALWQARQACPGLITLPPNYDLYLYLSGRTRRIFDDYTYKVEPFGLDEAKLDVSGNETLHTAKLLADKIRKRFVKELGLTASVGVANNKIMAKLGSDYRKPDATTLIRPEDYPHMVWPLSASDLLYVGPSTAAKLKKIGMYTIGDIVNAPGGLIQKLLGKNGEMIHTFALGNDISPVMCTGHTDPIKSIGNSTTTPRDLVSNADVILTLWVLAESVASRLRSHGFRAKTVQLYVRDKNLQGFERQATLQKPTQLAHDLVAASMDVFTRNYSWDEHAPVRSLGIRGCNLVPAANYVQMSIFPDENKRSKMEIIERTMDDIRDRYGHFAVLRASMLGDGIGDINPKEDHIIHPVSYRE